MKIQQTTLANGLQIVTASMPDARSVTVNIVAGTGSRYETYDTNGGVSHFLEHLLFKGTKKYPTAAKIAEAVDAVGGYNNAYTGEDITSFYIKVPARHGQLALDILADMVKSPLLESSEIDRERGVIVEEMNVFQDDPPRFIGTLVPSLIFPDNPLGQDIIGSEKVIENLSRAEIAGYMRQHYRPNNLVVAVAGAIDHAAVVQQMEAVLGSMESGEKARPVPVTKGISSQLALPYAKDTAQAHIMVAARSYAYLDEDEPASRVVAAILGRGMSSRLFLNVRERQGLAYNVFAETNSYVDTGIFEAYAGVGIDKIDQAIESVLAELDGIRQDEVGKAELAKAKQQLVAGLEMSLESNASIADRLGAQLALLGRVQPVDELIAAIEGVTADDVLRVARQMLAPERLRMAIIAPDPNRAAEQFAKLIQTK